MPPSSKAPCVVVANHESFVDAVALYAALEGPLVFSTSTDFERHRLFGPFLRRVGCVFVSRGRAEEGATSLARLQSVLEGGAHLVVFPEGSLSAAEGLRPFHLGAFEAASRARCAVVPVGLRGTAAVLPPGRFWPHRGALSAAIGEPIAPIGEDFASRVALRDRARAAVAELSGEVLLGGPGAS